MFKRTVSIFIPLIPSSRRLMTIPTVETLHHRRAFCISKFHPPQAFPSARTLSPLILDHSLDIPTQRISRASCSPHLRIRREERKQRILETQTAIPFTQVANFHSRKLPPLGTHAHNLDLPLGNTDPFHVGPPIDHKHHAANTNFQVGQLVRVRRFVEQENHWTNWEFGTIVDKSRFHGYVSGMRRVLAHWHFSISTLGDLHIFIIHSLGRHKCTRLHRPLHQPKHGPAYRRKICCLPGGDLWD